MKKFFLGFLLLSTASLSWAEEDLVWYCSSGVASIVYAGQEPTVGRLPLRKYKMKWDRESERIIVANEDGAIEYACTHCLQWSQDQEVRTELHANTKYFTLRFTDGQYLLTLTAQDFTSVEAGTCTKF